MRQMLLWSVITSFLSMVYIALGLALYVNRILRKVLKLIEPVSSH